MGAVFRNSHPPLPPQNPYGDYCHIPESVALPPPVEFSPRTVIECGGTFTRRETTMAKLLRCSDLGMNCPKEIRAATEEELLRLAAEHAEKDHGIPVSSIPAEMQAMVKAAIRDE